jgi:hypothetical protein
MYIFFNFPYVADLGPENETSGYIFIHAEGGLNQQRIAVRMCPFHMFKPLDTCVVNALFVPLY